jgi:hypothetical protein
MSETIGIGGLELRFLQTREETAGSLDAFEMTSNRTRVCPSPTITRAGPKPFTG